MLAIAVLALSLAAPVDVGGDVRSAQAEAPPPPIGSEAPPPPADAPSPDAPPSSAVPAPDAKVEPPGITPPLMTAIQFCAGCATATVVGPVVGWIPILGTLVLLPGAVALVEVFLGDLLGQQRGSLVLPWVGAAASAFLGQFVFIGGGVAIGYAFAGAAVAAFIAALASSGPNPAILIPIMIGGGIGLIVPILAGVTVYLISNALVPAVIYMLTAEDKRAGDTGGGFPGLLTPNHPTPSAQQVRARDAGRFVSAMAY
jgi:hypothetical protein